MSCTQDIDLLNIPHASHSTNKKMKTHWQMQKKKKQIIPSAIPAA